MIKTPARISLSVALLLSLSSCLTKVSNEGYVKEADFKDKLVVGQTSMDEVRNQFGSPSSQSSFGDPTWYYITDRKESVAFFKPEVVDQHVTAVAFDSAGKVSSVEALDKSNAREVDVVSRTTPTEGHTLGFFEQVLGNVGRFNHPTGNDSIAPGRKESSGY